MIIMLLKLVKQILLTVLKRHTKLHYTPKSCHKILGSKSQSYQEARGVVQQTAEAADEASLQERGVFRWKLFRVVAHKAGRC